MYTPVETITVRSGFTHMAASCDTLMLYNRSTGRALVGTLSGERFRNRSPTFIPQGYHRASATCRGLLMLGIRGNQSFIQSYVLNGGDLAVRADTTFSAGHPDLGLATTRDSVLLLMPVSFGPTGMFGFWGPVDVGADPPVQFLTNSTNFNPWKRIAGTASSLQFYNPDGQECRWWLAGGSILASACSGTLAGGYTVIAGCK